MHFPVLQYQVITCRMTSDFVRFIIQLGIMVDCGQSKLYPNRKIRPRITAM